MAQWIGCRTLNYEIAGSNLLAETVVSLGKVLFNTVETRYKEI